MASIHADLIAKRCTLDWSEVQEADEETLGALLAGVSMDDDALGLATADGIPEHVMDLIERALSPSSPEEPTPAGPVPPSHDGGVQVWRTDTAAKPTRRVKRQSSGREEKILVAPKPVELRALFEDMVVRDLLGPLGGPEEEVDEASVRSRYVLGVLAPRRLKVAAEAEEDLAAEDAGSGEDGASERDRVGAPTMFPSSVGMSFNVSDKAAGFCVTASWGAYARLTSTFATEADGKPKRVWKRTHVEATSPTMPLVAGDFSEWVISAKYPKVRVKGRIRRHAESWFVTIFLVNEQDEPDRNRDEAWLFQIELSVAAPEGQARAIFTRRPPRARDPVTWAEEHSLDMLYRDHVEFAVGHGISVHADTEPGHPQRAVSIRTKVVPASEVPQQTAPTALEEPSLAALPLDMKELAGISRETIASRLAPLPNAYAAWIARQRARIDDSVSGLKDYRDAAASALDRCERTLARIREGIELIASNDHAYRAFAFANESMAMQRVQTHYAEDVRRGGTPVIEEIDVARNRSWRLFQLAFMLLNLPGIALLDHEDRTREQDATADLLWFPTGGGKTEAYLGLTAFTLAIRRLQGTLEGRSGEYGVAVLMRYTLRLLTLQQCQRATTLICACETIRRTDPSRWGKEPFRIGLWVGERTTPNKTADADEWLKQSHGQYKAGALAGVGSPSLLTNCPWCGRAIDPGKHLRVESFAKGSGRTFVFCSDAYGRCPFSEAKAPGEGIPLVVVDEEIYRLLPSLLISTVDKFALMAWKGPVQMLFGQVSGRCERHGFRSPELEDSDTHPKTGRIPAAKTTVMGALRPPDLIIQDELHLISGPLGTLVGLYETAVDQLCSWTVAGHRVRPKVIASTATTRRSGDQMHALFLRRVAVFPPHGVDVDDNFFSKQRAPSTEHPGRRYLGITATGRRLKAVLIRVYVASLAASQRLFDLYGRAADPWMTTVGYFNAMRELAGMRRLIDDDVRSRLRDTDERGLARRNAPITEELTSRKGSTDIPVLLDRLEVPFDPATMPVKGAKSHDKPRPLDVLLATNMISVGVDVKRLGLMIVAGQPKTTAEYIQATSRVGRVWPGVVFTVFNWARPRDLSHYESFEHYHATFYKQVEALSVTPFAPRALDRGLSGVFVALVRLAGLPFNPNESAETLDREHPLVKQAVARIVARAELVSGSKKIGDDVQSALKRRLDTWLREATKKAGGTRLGYREKRDGQTRALLSSPTMGEWEEFTCLWSLRDVEPTVNLVLDDGRLDDDPPVAAGAEVPS